MLDNATVAPVLIANSNVVAAATGALQGKAYSVKALVLIRLLSNHNVGDPVKSQLRGFHDFRAVAALGRLTQISYHSYPEKSTPSHSGVDVLLADRLGILQL